MQNTPQQSDLGHAASLAGEADDGSPMVSEHLDDEILASLLGLFAEQFQGMLASIDTALAENRLSDLARLCHKARGSSSTYGFPVLAGELAGLEALAVQGASEGAMAASVGTLHRYEQRILKGLPADQLLPSQE